jgi:uncharacterized membrane protein YfcA
LTVGWVALWTNLALGNVPSSEVASRELAPAALLTTGVMHWAWRAPYRRVSLWEWPLFLFSILGAFVGGLRFQPESDPDPAFSWFFASYVAFALSYGFFCTAIGAEDPLRQKVIAPTKRISKLGIPFLDVGLVVAPFVFPLLLLRYLLARR